jgi:hypothetical protein
MRHEPPSPLPFEMRARHLELRLCVFAILPSEGECGQTMQNRHVSVNAHPNLIKFQRGVGE